jgi:ATP phosphoribosyltransferase
MQLKMVLPKGRIYQQVAQLLADIGIHLSGAERNYRPDCSHPDISIKLLKSQNIPPLVALGQHDIGFAGLDWIEEQQAELTILEQLGFNPVKIVAAIPADMELAQLRTRPIIAVSEYRHLCQNYLQQQGFDYTFVRSYGATEVFPPEDADLIVDNSSTGTTLAANGLKVIATLMTSSTCLVANPQALEDHTKRDYIDNLLLLIRSVLAGRQRVLLEMNCPKAQLEEIVNVLPAMKSPTIAQLFQSDDFSIKVAVNKQEVSSLIPKLAALGASDILETPVRKVIL